MNAEIIAVGSELLLGQIVNTNAQFLSKQLAEIGINMYYHTVVGDNSDRLKHAIQVAKNRSDLLIFTGGLGPTKDDLTKETIAEMLGATLELNQEALENVKQYFIKTKREMPENNRKQALVLLGSYVLKNDVGMAPGMIYHEETTEQTYILFPGPPKEMETMFLRYAKPYLLTLLDEHACIESRVLRFFDIGESRLETTLEDLIEKQTNPTIAPLAKEGEVTLRITAKHTKKEEALRLIDETESKILSRVGHYFYGYHDTTLALEAVKQLKEQHLTISCAESLTGGSFSQAITDIPGASSFFKGGIVCYTNEIKHTLLNVPFCVLETDGAVSEITAKLLAEHIREQTNSDIGISFTGVAGPSKSEGKPVGTVYIGLATKNDTIVFKLALAGSRQSIRKETVNYGFFYILKQLKKGK